MKFAVALAVMVVVTQSASGASLTVDSGTCRQTSPDIAWWGQAFYLNDAGELGVGVGMSGNLVLYDSYKDPVRSVAWGSLSGSWEGQYVSTLHWAICYYTAINAATFDTQNQQYGNTTCNPRPPSFPGGGLEYCDRYPAAEECLAECPLIVNLSDSPWQLTDPEGGVAFDLDADGKLERTSWTAEQSPVAFLALDVNQNGAIDDGSELFGQHTKMRDSSAPANGFVALEQYDDDGDGQITAADAVWSSLLLWRDADHDGVSTPVELQPVAASAIESLSTRYRWSGRVDPHGNQFRYSATCQADHPRAYYDVYLRVRRQR